MSFRFVLQPVVAAIFAIIAGLEDARLGRRPYLWAILTEPANRAALVKEGWTRIGKVFLVAILLDLLYQVVVLRCIRARRSLSRPCSRSRPMSSCAASSLGPQEC